MPYVVKLSSTCVLSSFVLLHGGSGKLFYFVLVVDKLKRTWVDEENSGGGSISNFTASIVSISSDHAASTSCFETKRRSRRKLEALEEKTVLGIKNDQTTEELLKVRDLTLNRCINISHSEEVSESQLSRR